MTTTLDAKPGRTATALSAHSATFSTTMGSVAKSIPAAKLSTETLESANIATPASTSTPQAPALPTDPTTPPSKAADNGTMENAWLAHPNTTPETTMIACPLVTIAEIGTAPQEFALTATTATS